MKRRAPEFLKYLEPGESRAEPLFTPEELRSLAGDITWVCLKNDPVNWWCSWTELVKALRHNRYAFIQAPKKWVIPIDAELKLREQLQELGFLFTKVGPDMLKPSPALSKLAKSRRSKAAAQSTSLKLLPIELEMTVEELLAELADSLTDQKRKKLIRAKLRRMGHRGGLKNEAT